ncbi:MAG: Fe-S protein assembly co-chaperone HscB [Terriglobales bacterium]
MARAPSPAKKSAEKSGWMVRAGRALALNFVMANVESKSTLVMPGDALGEATPSCWSCGTMRAVHFCNACGKVQPPVPVDYFTFFGFPRKLNLDTAALEKEFYALSRKLHPDVFGQADDQERTWSLEQSSRLNDAYRTLKDPIKRTEYLLKLEGIELEEQSKQATEKARATGELKKQVVPPDLLEEVFEFNIQLEEARKVAQVGKALDKGQHSSLLTEELQEQKRKFERDIETNFEELKVLWEKWDRLINQTVVTHSVADQDTKQILDDILNLLNRRNYFRNLVNDADEAIENLES